MRRILILANTLGGLYNFRLEMVSALIKNGYEVIIATPMIKNTEMYTAFSDMGCHMIEVSFDKRGINPFADLKLFYLYKRLIKEYDIDLVLTYTVKANIYGGFAAKFAKVPYIANITGVGSVIVGDSILKSAVLKMYKMALRKASCVFFQNEANQKLMIEHVVVTGKNVLIPGSGVSLERFHCFPYPEEKENISVLFVGKIMKEKGAGELFQLIKIIKEKHKNVSFTLVGSLDDSYADHIKTYEQDGLISYPGRTDNVNEVMAKHHVIFNPTHHEGMSNVLLEAAATGRPVLASNIPGCYETFDEGVSGFGFEVKNVDDMVRVIEKFIALPWEEKRKMGLAGRAKMEKEFDRNIVVKAYMEEIVKVLGE